MILSWHLCWWHPLCRRLKWIDNGRQKEINVNYFLSLRLQEGFRLTCEITITVCLESPTIICPFDNRHILLWSRKVPKILHKLIVVVDLEFNFDLLTMKPMVYQVSFGQPSNRFDNVRPSFIESWRYRMWPRSTACLAISTAERFCFSDLFLRNLCLTPHNLEWI